MDVLVNKHVQILCSQARRLYDVLHKPFLKSKTNNNWTGWGGDVDEVGKQRQTF